MLYRRRDFTRILPRARELTAALTVLATPVTFADAQVPTGISWPMRYAIGVLDHTYQMPPTTVEATSDGWVVVNFLAGRPDEGLELPSRRLLAQPRDVRRWVARVRALLAPAGDTVTNRELPPLGNGGFQVHVNVAPSSRNEQMYFGFRACDKEGGRVTPSREEMARFVDLLDKAAIRAGGESRRAASFRRPYYQSEVSCPAIPKGSEWVSFPRSLPANERRRTEIGVRFIVDTSGRIERGSIEFLPGTNARFGSAARRDMRLWHYYPAERDGTPVRQIVQTRIVFAPPDSNANLPSHAIAVSATDDGWVHLRHASEPWQHHVLREWYTPDSVDAWVRRVAALNTEAASLTRSGAAPDSGRTTWLGSALGVRYAAGYVGNQHTVERVAGLSTCSGVTTAWEKPLDAATLAKFSAAARVARSRRAKPATSVKPYAADDVTCSAWLPWSRDTSDATTRLWRYPTGVYPAAMARDNVRAEVLVSFVVDSSGVPDRNTLQVIGSADPRAAAAVPATVSTFRFRPATRGGIAVAQRVIQTILFEPPAICVRSTPREISICDGPR